MARLTAECTKGIFWHGGGDRIYHAVSGARRSWTAIPAIPQCLFETEEWEEKGKVTGNKRELLQICSSGGAVGLVVQLPKARPWALDSHLFEIPCLGGGMILFTAGRLISPVHDLHSFLDTSVPAQMLKLFSTGWCYIHCRDIFIQRAHYHRT